MPRGNEARVPQLLSPHAATTDACVLWPVLHREKPPQ